MTSDGLVLGLADEIGFGVRIEIGDIDKDGLFGRSYFVKMRENTRRIHNQVLKYVQNRKNG